MTAPTLPTIDEATKALNKAIETLHAVNQATVFHAHANGRDYIVRPFATPTPYDDLPADHAYLNVRDYFNDHDHDHDDFSVTDTSPRVGGIVTRITPAFATDSAYPSFNPYQDFPRARRTTNPEKDTA